MPWRRAQFAVSLLAMVMPCTVLGVASGTGQASQSSRPTTVAEARAAYDETVRKCDALTIASVRAECLRQAKRQLDLELERLRAAERSR